MGIENYSVTPDDNSDAPPNGAPEGMAANTVNNVQRQVMADIKGGTPYTVANLTALKALDSTKQVTGNLITLTGLTVAGTGSGVFRYDSASSATPDDVDVVEPTDTLGRWLRNDEANQFDQSLNTTDSPTFVGLSIDTMDKDWTNTGRTVADLGTITTVDINGGTIDGVNIGDSSVGTGAFSTLSATDIADFTTAGARFGADAAENTLDDYEILTWTPVVEGGGTAGTYTLTITGAKYVKDGSRVTVWAKIAFSAASGGTGNLHIRGLPFNYAASTLPTGGISFNQLDLVSATPATVVISANSSGASDVMHLDECVDNGATTITLIGGVSTSTVLFINLTYFTDL